MKKVIIASAMFMAGLIQAASFTWGTGMLLDNVNGSDYEGDLYAKAGTTMILIYNSTGNFGGIQSDGNGGYVYADGDQFMSSFVTDSDDFDAGTATRTLNDIPQSWLGNAGAWENLNSYVFTIVAVTAEGLYNYYTSHAEDFSTAMGPDSMGGMTTGSFDASARGAIPVVPEPTSLALLALGVAAMGLRRKVK